MTIKKSPISKCWLAVAASGGIVGLAAAWACLTALVPDASSFSAVRADSGRVEPSLPPDTEQSVSASTGTPLPGGAISECVGMQYARAVQAGDADRLMESLVWVSERLEQVALGTSDPAERQALRDRLAASLLERNVEGNRLRPEGIEDKYVFVPGASLEVVRIDKGRDDLARPVEERDWIRVTFPSRPRAPLDRSGRAIRSLVVGVNLDAEGHVLKAGIVGNLDIDRETLGYWDSPQGA